MKYSLWLLIEHLFCLRSNITPNGVYGLSGYLTTPSPTEATTSNGVITKDRKNVEEYGGSLLKVVSYHLPGVILEDHKKSYSEKLISG
jgi:hypothetical protein